jgi:putative ABC transport system permease protein
MIRHWRGAATAVCGSTRGAWCLASEGPRVKLALRFLLREWRAGELHILLLALAVAVAAVTTVSFFTDRVRQALVTQANQLLAADLVIISDHPLNPDREAKARELGLRIAHTVAFPSMVVADARTQLAEVKGVSVGYPLRGTLAVSGTTFAPEHSVESGPPAGAAWADARLMQQLGLQVGSHIEVGTLRLPIGAVIAKEPDRAGDFFNIAPRLMLNDADISRTGLIQTGSRVRYRLLLAGNQPAVAAYRSWVEARLTRGERVEGVADARPEIRAALERAQKYLGLAALVSAVLAAVAVSMAARRFVERNLDGCAVMRCLGASQGRIFRLYLVQFAVLGLLAGALGAGIGLVAQAVLADLLRQQMAIELPAPGLRPLGEGVLIGMTLLLAFGLAPLTRLTRVPTLRVLRRELAPPTRLGVAGYALGAAAIGAMLLWKAGDRMLGLYVGGGLVGVLLVSWVAAWLLVHAVAVLRGRAHGVWFYGLANVTRRRQSSLLQIIAFSLGLMALLLLTLVRSDLLATWQQSLPADAPNRFVINMQPDQIEPAGHFFAERGLTAPDIYPMVRGRLVSINDRPVSARDYVDDRSQRLVEREFNLSWADRARPDNRIVGGRFWRGEAVAQWSVEEGIAQRLGVRLGDTLVFEVAGKRIPAVVSNLRKVDWDSMRVNFFVVGTPDLLRNEPATYITSFYLPQGKEQVLDELVRRFPNLTVIDVAAIMRDVRAIMERVAQAVEFVFLFTLLAGLVVLYAAVVATRDERVYEAAVMRTLGARRRQLQAAQWIEFAVVGALAGLLAATGAVAVAWGLSKQVLNLPFTLNPLVWLVGVGAGGIGVALAGVLATRRVLREPPINALRQLT